jgi:hypothetical protein
VDDGAELGLYRAAGKLVAPLRAAHRPDRGLHTDAYQHGGADAIPVSVGSAGRTRHKADLGVAVIVSWLNVPRLSASPARGAEGGRRDIDQPVQAVAELYWRVEVADKRDDVTRWDMPIGSTTWVVRGGIGTACLTTSSRAH